MESNFSVTLDRGVANITLTGNLDTTNAPQFQTEIMKLVGQPVEKMAFFAQDLEYISSAGLRVIIFTKQKMGVDVKIYLIGAKESVLSVIKMSGLDNFLHIQDTFEG